MISFAPTEEQESVRSAMRDFAAQAMRPLAREMDEASAVTEALLAQTWDLGLAAAQTPEAYGGYGGARSLTTNAILLEELAFGDAALALAAVTPASFATALLDHGTDEQRQQYLPRFGGAKYEAGALAVCEPQPLFDVYAPRTTAKRKGDRWVLQGEKCMVAMGDRASAFLVVAAGEKGLDAFLVEREAAGLKITAPEKNLGLKALPTASLRFDGVEVAAAARLGGEKGADVARLIQQSRVALAAVMTGVSRAVFEYCVPYAKERVAFGEAIARKQSIAFRLAEMHMEIECMRWMTWKAASELEHGEDASRSAHQARQYAAEKSMWVADNGVQVLGGHGFIREHPVEMWYRNARTLGVLEGAALV